MRQVLHTVTLQGGPANGQTITLVDAGAPLERLLMHGRLFKIDGNKTHCYGYTSQTTAKFKGTTEGKRP